LEYVNQGYDIIAINSFSKSYGLAGMRVGNAYPTKEIAQYINNGKRPFMLNTVSMEAARGALQDEKFIKKIIEDTIRNKHELYSALGALSI
jgi:histidinol-phosphate aminotransferase